MTDAAISRLQSLKSDAAKKQRRAQWFSMGLPLLILGYLAYAWVALGVADNLRGADWSKGGILAADLVSHKTHVTRSNRTGEIEVTLEGDTNKGLYPVDAYPDWIDGSGDTMSVQLEDGTRVDITPDEIAIDLPEYGLLLAHPDGAVNPVWPDTLDPEALPDNFSYSRNLLIIGLENGQIKITRSATEIWHYDSGWENFWFGFDSEYWGVGFGAVMGAMLSGQAGTVLNDFWSNPAWQHGIVAEKLLETLLIAFLGTLTAAIVALPLAFAGSRKFGGSPIMSGLNWLSRRFFDRGLRFTAWIAPERFVARRGFDFLRGVDALIWTVILTRPFGLGPLAAVLAIALTETGSFGKIFSEALDNVEDKQIEGIQSTGARPIQRYRFGVIPQVMPVLLSQVLYFFESNTRSATIVGAITGAGMGTLLTNAISAGNKWEMVAYYILLTLILIFAMDSLSGKLRRRLIKGDAEA